MSADDSGTSDSPCNLICTIDTESGMCLGCGRTEKEIADWPHQSQTARARILAQLPARMPDLEKKLAERRKRRRPNRRRAGSGGV